MIILQYTVYYAIVVLKKRQPVLIPSVSRHTCSADGKHEL